MNLKTITGALLLVVLVAIAPPARAQQDSKIRALFVLKFIENVTWPDDRKSVVIGVIGKDDEIVTELLARLQARNPNGIKVRHISAAEASTCDVIYLSRSGAPALAQVGAGSRTLIISETDLSKRGSGISFVEEGGRLTYVINKSALEERGLKVSSTLLSLGKQV